MTLLDSLTNRELLADAARVSELSPFFAELAGRDDVLSKAAFENIDSGLDESALKARYQDFLTANSSEPLPGRLRQST